MQMKFPKRFLWGASTSAHQVEGNTHNQWTVWELENAKASAHKAEYLFQDLESWPRIKAMAKDPANYVSGDAADHYVRYEEDFQLAKSMGMNALRYSIEWSRVEPEEGVWNAEAIEHYRHYTMRLKEMGIEPVVTLFHFTLPVWFAAQGGFAKRSNVKYFVRFVEKIMSELGGNIRFVVTINDPIGYARESYYDHNWPPALVRKRYKFWRVVNNLAYAHKKAAKLIHRLDARYKVTIAYNAMYFYPGDNAWLSRVSTAWMQFFNDDYFLGKVAKHCDFLGINFYSSNRVYGYRVHNPEERLGDDGRDLSPADLQFLLERLHREYKKPIIILETGVADAQDIHRKWFIMQHLIAIQKAMGHGVDIRGYLHRNLIDGEEWALGKWPRYGLAHVDYKTKKRTLRPSAIWFGAAIKKLRNSH